MYKFKYIKILLIVIMIIIVIFLILEFVPIKYAKKISDLTTKNGESIYVCRLTTYTGPEWTIVSKKNVIKYHKYKEEQQVIVDGVKLPFLLRDSDSYIYTKRVFIFEGKIIAKRKYTKDDPTLYPVLKVNKWYMEYPIRRDYFKMLSPKGYLTLSDIDWLRIVKLLFYKN